MKKHLATILVFLFMMVQSAFAVTVKFGTVAPDGTPWADTLKEIKKDVEKESNGEINIKNYLGGQLGGELEILSGIRRGRIHGGGITSAALASAIPEMAVLEIPFLFDSYEEADYVLDNFLVEPFRKIFDNKGLIFVSWAENGWRNIGLKTKHVKHPRDLKGVKIRSQEARAHLEFWKKLEANPVPIAVPEVLSALQTGLVDGFDNTALFTLAAEWHSAIKFYTVSQHIYQPAAVIYSKKFWETLKPGQQKILMGKGNGMAAPSRAAVRALGGDLLTVMKESGIEVYKLTESERNRLKNEVKDLPERLVKEMGGESQKIYDLVLKGKKEFAAKWK